MLYPTCVFAQWGHIDIPDWTNNLPGIEDIIAGIPGLGSGQYEEALTVSLDDAITEVPFLDSYNPTDFQTLLPIPERPGRYHLIPGRWELAIQSYCLHAGTYGPTSGDGYLFAPLSGPRAGVITHILRNSSYYPDIPQRDIQTLIWGILARSSINDISEEEQHAASLLLTADEIHELNGGAMDIVPDEAWSQVFAQVDLPSPLQKIVEAEGRIRSAISSGASYNELENIAILPGVRPTENDTRELPEGRWSYHPDGYFVRYKPNGYSKTSIQVSVPDIFTLGRDELGRINSIEDNQGNRIDVQYDYAAEPFMVPGDDTPYGYAFNDVSFTISSEKVTNPEDSIASLGWTLVTVPDSRARSARGFFSDAPARIEWGTEHQSQVLNLTSHAPQSASRDRHASDAIQLGLLVDGIQKVATGDNARIAIEFLQEAWQFEIRMAMLDLSGNTGTITAHASSGEKHSKQGGGGDSDDDYGMDLSGGSAVGPQGSQILGLSGRPFEDQPTVEDLVRQGRFDRGWDQGISDGYYDGYRDGEAGNPPFPVPLIPLVPPDPSWWAGYEGGYSSGYNKGYAAGSSP
jgi:hypothetical protein